MSEKTVTVHPWKISYTASEANREEYNNYISSHYGLQEQDITKTLNSAAVKCGSGKIVDAFIKLVPGSNYIKAAEDGIDIVSAPLTKAKEVADFQKISDIGDIGSVATLFSLAYISSDINNEPSKHCFSLYPTIKNPLEPGNLSTAECLKNFNENLLYNPKYEQYKSDAEFDKSLTMDDLLNHPKGS